MQRHRPDLDVYIVHPSGMVACVTGTLGVEVLSLGARAEDLGEDVLRAQ